jgi:hypothetical protein
MLIGDSKWSVGVMHFRGRIACLEIVGKSQELDATNSIYGCSEVETIGAESEMKQAEGPVIRTASTPPLSARFFFIWRRAGTILSMLSAVNLRELIAASISRYLNPWRARRQGLFLGSEMRRTWTCLFAASFGADVR